MNDVHHSLDLVAQKSELTLDQRYTSFTTAESSYWIGFSIGALGSAAVAKNARTALKANNLNSVAMAGATAAGAVVATAAIVGLPTLFVGGSLAAAGGAVYNAAKYATVSSGFATMLGFASSQLGENDTLLPNIDGASFMKSHYRMEMHYKFTKGLESECLLFFAIETWSPGYVINYEIDSCPDSEIFPQNQHGWGLRTGEHIDIVDRAIGQDMVVTSGQVKIRQNQDLNL